jgi:polysaccharide export outer membrane protein
VVAFVALLAAVVAGVVPFAETFSGFGHPATVTVALVLVISRGFQNSGAVKKPGSYAYVSGMPVVNAIALAGGHTYRARENKILLTRATDPKNVKHPADHDTQVLPGDVIEVPERFF